MTTAPASQATATTLMVSLAARGDIHYAVLVAPDADFVPAVKAAKNNGTVVFLAAGEIPSPSWDLRKECDQFIALDGESLRRIRRDVGPR